MFKMFNASPSFMPKQREETQSMRQMRLKARQPRIRKYLQKYYQSRRGYHRHAGAEEERV
jgi:hypothetical protein